MPSLPEQESTVGSSFALIAIVILTVGPLVGLALADPSAFAFALACVLVGGGLLYLIAERNTRKHFAQLTRGRQDESICTFARSLDMRITDPWVVRATWDEVQDWIVGRKADFPLRTTDRLTEDLWIQPEDVEDVVELVARRAGRSLEANALNPLYGKVSTVGDLVRFLNAQPAAASA
ncbi:MAG: hypothetical protein AAFN13_11895 [Bacteroidota bacterium]